MNLLDEKGIDVLANTVEASALSCNQPFYGSLHNCGHILTANISDPLQKYTNDYGVIGQNTTGE